MRRRQLEAYAKLSPPEEFHQWVILLWEAGLTAEEIVEKVGELVYAIAGDLTVQAREKELRARMRGGEPSEEVEDGYAAMEPVEPEHPDRL